MIRKNLLHLLSNARGNSFENELKEVTNIRTTEQLITLQEGEIGRILSHSCKNVPYYRELFRIINVFDCEKHYKQFDSILCQIPILTKDVIRKEKKRLISEDYRLRKYFYNSSGGSTGEPVRFIQDSFLTKWVNVTLRYYYETIVGIDELSVKKIMLWGSERDIFNRTIGIRAKTLNWVGNIKWLNSFRMTKIDMERYIKVINLYKPKLILGYAGSLYEFSKFIKKANVSIHSPNVVISSAETLTEEMRHEIESEFQTKVYNFYGSRETPAIAGECSKGLLHVFSFHNTLHLLDSNNVPVKEGQMGRVIVSSLHNFSMPLIRYQIGDTAVLGPNKCSCGNPLPTLQKINGRITDHFIKEDGTIIHGEYFTHLFYFKDWVKAFQIIQEDYSKVRILIVLQNEKNLQERINIENKIRLVMGRDCAILWDFVDNIPPTENGKRIYTKSLLHCN